LSVFFADNISLIVSFHLLPSHLTFSFFAVLRIIRFLFLHFWIILYYCWMLFTNQRLSGNMRWKMIIWLNQQHI